MAPGQPSLCDTAFQPASGTQPKRWKVPGASRAAARQAHTQSSQQGWAAPRSIDAWVSGVQDQGSPFTSPYAADPGCPPGKRSCAHPPGGWPRH